VAAGDRGGARQLSAGEGLAATDGFGTGGRVCRRNPGRIGDRRAGRLAASPRDAHAPAAPTCMSLRKFPSTCSPGRRRTPLGPCTTRPVMLRGSPRLAKKHQRVSKRAQRGYRARVAPTTPTASDPRPSGNVSGSAVSDRDPPIRDYFQKTESDLTRSSSQRLGGTRKLRAEGYAAIFSISSAAALLR